MKGDDGLRTANYLEERLLTEYRSLDEHTQRSARKMVHALLRAKTTAATKPKRRPRIGESDVDVARRWVRDLGRRARQGT